MGGTGVASFEWGITFEFIVAKYNGRAIINWTFFNNYNMRQSYINKLFFILNYLTFLIHQVHSIYLQIDLKIGIDRHEL